MSVKTALLFGIIIAVSLLLLTWLIGHAWAFSIMVGSTLVAIAVTSYQEGKALRKKVSTVKTTDRNLK